MGSLCPIQLYLGRHSADPSPCYDGLLTQPLSHFQACPHLTGTEVCQEMELPWSSLSRPQPRSLLSGCDSRVERAAFLFRIDGEDMVCKLCFSLLYSLFFNLPFHPMGNGERRADSEYIPITPSLLLLSSWPPFFHYFPAPRKQELFLDHFLPLDTGLTVKPQGRMGHRL